MALKYHLQSIDNVPKAYTDNDSEDSGSDVFDNLPGTDLEDSSAPFSDVCSETWPNTGCDFSSLIDSHIAMCDSLFQSHGEKNVGTAAAIEIMAGTSKVSLTRSDTDKPLSGQIVDCLLDPYDIFRPSGRVFIKPSWPENPKVTGAKKSVDANGPLEKCRSRAAKILQITDKTFDVNKISRVPGLLCADDKDELVCLVNPPPTTKTSPRNCVDDASADNTVWRELCHNMNFVRERKRDGRKAEKRQVFRLFHGLRVFPADERSYGENLHWNYESLLRNSSLKRSIGICKEQTAIRHEETSNGKSQLLSAQEAHTSQADGCGALHQKISTKNPDPGYATHDGHCANKICYDACNSEPDNPLNMAPNRSPVNSAAECGKHEVRETTGIYHKMVDPLKIVNILNPETAQSTLAAVTSSDKAASSHSEPKTQEKAHSRRFKYYEEAKRNLSSESSKTKMESWQGENNETEKPYALRAYERFNTKRTVQPEDLYPVHPRHIRGESSYYSQKQWKGHSPVWNESDPPQKVKEVISTVKPVNNSRRLQSAKHGAIIETLSGEAEENYDVSGSRIFSRSKNRSVSSATSYKCGSLPNAASALYNNAPSRPAATHLTPGPAFFESRSATQEFRNSSYSYPKYAAKRGKTNTYPGSFANPATSAQVVRSQAMLNGDSNSFAKKSFETRKAQHQKHIFYQVEGTSCAGESDGFLPSKWDDDYRYTASSDSAPSWRNSSRSRPEITEPDMSCSKLLLSKKFAVDQPTFSDDRQPVQKAARQIYNVTAEPWRFQSRSARQPYLESSPFPSYTAKLPYQERMSGRPKCDTNSDMTFSKIQQSHDPQKFTKVENALVRDGSKNLTYHKTVTTTKPFVWPYSQNLNEQNLPRLRDTAMCNKKHPLPYIYLRYWTEPNG